LSNKIRNPNKREEIEKAVNNIAAGCGTEHDFDKVRDPNLMGNHASGDQAATIIEAAQRLHVPNDVWGAAAVVLARRWRQGSTRLSRMRGLRLPQAPE